MTEVLNPSQRIAFKESLILDDHALYPKNSDTPIPIDAVHHYLNKGKLGATAPMPGIDDLDRAYKKRNIKHARAILDRLTRYEQAVYSPLHNRVLLNDLAHPIHRYLAIQEYDGVAPTELGKDIEAIYGRGAQQLAFLLTQFDEHIDTNPQLAAKIEGGLSEMTVFLLPARALTDDMTDPYLIVPSTEIEDRARVTPDDVHHGFDLTAIRRRDSVRIPVQVKTRTTHLAKYPDNILVVSVADLVSDHKSTPRKLAEALYLDISGSRNCDSELINTASKRLFKAFDNYSCPE